MPDVRHGCAAQSSAPRASRLHHSSSRADTSPAHRLNSSDSRRCPLTSPRSSSSVSRRRNRHVFPEHNHAHPAPLTARPPWLAVPPRRRYQAIRSSSLYRVASPRAQPQRSRLIERRRKARNARLRTTAGIRLIPVSSAYRPCRPRTFQRASAAPVLLNLPRFHSAVPNPGIWTPPVKRNRGGARSLRGVVPADSASRSTRDEGSRQQSYLRPVGGAACRLRAMMRFAHGEPIA